MNAPGSPKSTMRLLWEAVADLDHGSPRGWEALRRGAQREVRRRFRLNAPLVPSAAPER